MVGFPQITTDTKKPLLPPHHHHHHVFPPTVTDLSLSTIPLNRASFPPGFTFGVSTSAYQIEGAVAEDGKCLSIWDSFAHTKKHILDGSTPDVSCNSYNMYEDDIKLLVDMGVDAYRFSISWPRIFSDDIYTLNEKGVAHYNKFINKLLKNGIEPYVTLYHWDLPQVLENDPAVKGWRTQGIVAHYSRFAETCFKMFGDRVKNWITFNEPQLFSVQGYGFGLFAPGRTQNSSTEPYIVTHNILLGHAAVVSTYRKHYQAEQGGRIGITCNSFWYKPFTTSTEDVEAAQRFLEFELGWILDPIMKGDYPDSMRERAGSRLPSFTTKESMELEGSVDFIGINYYTSRYAKCPHTVDSNAIRWYDTDRYAIATDYDATGELIGELMGPVNAFDGWIHNCPWGLPKLIGWITDRYGKDDIMKVPIIITENGCSDKNGYEGINRALDDNQRVQYMSDTLQHLAACIKEKQYNVEGYFAWCLLDSFEWISGLSCRMGLHYVDFNNKQKRYPKLSATWFKTFLNPQYNSSQANHMQYIPTLSIMDLFSPYIALLSCCIT